MRKWRGISHHQQSLKGCEYMEVIYLNCGDVNESDRRSNEHYLSSSEKKA